MIYGQANGGRSWALITSAAPWAERDNLNAEVTSEGILIVAAGFNSREALNDVWISADGGWTWGQCLKESSWSDRRWQMTLLDRNGYLYIVGGEEHDNGRVTPRNDVWKSSFAFTSSNRLKLSRSCNMQFPQCTTGLSCFPGSTTKVTVDALGRSKVSCPLLVACELPNPAGDDSESSSASNAAMGTAVSDGSSSGMSVGSIALTATLVSAAVVLIAAYCYYQHMKEENQSRMQVGSIDDANLLATDNTRHVISLTSMGTTK